jgi:hypothetical protein
VPDEPAVFIVVDVETDIPVVAVVVVTVVTVV